MKIVIFGCKDTTVHFSKFLFEMDYELNLVTIAPEKGIKLEVAGYVDILNSEFSCFFREIYVAERYDLASDSDATYFKSKNFSAGFCIGWQRLIPEHILTHLQNGVYGMHGSSRDLPFGRGRSPMNWSLIEGRHHFITNLFKYTPGVDDGPIVDTKCFSINSSDTAETLHYKNTLAMASLAQKNIERILRGELTTKPQKQGVPTFYPKRNIDDGLIDWDDDINSIDRLVRAVAKPFYGAFSYIEGTRIVVDRVGIFYLDLEDHSFKTAVNGEVCDVFLNGKFLVKCSGGVVIVHEYQSTIEMHPGMVMRIPNDMHKRYFQRNIYGFFDLEAK